MAEVGLAVVIGAGGGLGTALVAELRQRAGYQAVLALGRPALDILSEESIAAAAARIAGDGRPLRLVIDATGFLHDQRFGPERTWRQIDPVHMAHAFAVNAIGPALLMKHFLPLLAGEGAAVFATLSARVGSIGDNRLGGWYSYRASKAALNQLVRTASVELGRVNKGAVCVALHPGTVATALSAPFVRSGLEVQTPELAAGRLLDVIAGLGPAPSGAIFEHLGKEVAW
jgi:NAD(P)-dependent dehydrogenase (short-subunit alcohol dehydrogenase family)